MACSSMLASQNLHTKLLNIRLFNTNGSRRSSLTTMPLKINPLTLHFSRTHQINGGFEEDQIVTRRNGIQLYSHPNRTKFSVQASAASSSSSSSRSETSSSTKVVLISFTITVLLAVANRVLYKLALVPMKHYPSILAQVHTFGYVAVYATILFMRYRAGIVTDDMLAIPKRKFMLVGLLEALGVLARMSCGVMLPGPAIPILNQAFLLWQLGFSALLLGRRYSWNKLVACCIVAAGILVAVGSGRNTGNMLSGIGIMWPLLAICASGCQAGSAVLKESIFIDSATRLKGKNLDIFVVNTFGSTFQALFVLLLLPLLANFNGVPFSQFLSYIKSGAGCLVNVGGVSSSMGGGCNGAPLLPILYIITNIVYNISLLNLVKVSSALVFSLAANTSVPLSVFILSCPLPYLPQGVRLGEFFFLGCAILVGGLLLYNAPQRTKKEIV
ncbi:protein CLT2, chloroplastic-like [Impatiens glandulifera]|uniref:protein CLT2, chloroplastic-like n=1 Tax=Impatiens glandulifera TaxID=253017 RepID=UPI001FB12CBD|nr:protein CLT2, chloroplastic-like [Impatiens glandulifera]